MGLSRRTDARHFGALYVSGALLGEAPLYDFRNEKLIRSKLHAAYQAGVILAFAVGNYYCLRESYLHAFRNMALHMVVTSAASTVFLGLHPIVSVYASYKHRELIGEILGNLQKIDRYLHNKINRRGNNILFYLEIIISHIFIAYVTFGMLTTRLMQGRVPDYEIFEMCARYAIFIRSLLIYNVGKALQGCWEGFNDYMENFRVVNFVVIYDERGRRFVPKVVDNMRLAAAEMSRIYEDLCGIVAAFNGAFGLDMLFLFAEFITIIIAFLNILVYPWKKVVTIYDYFINSIRILFGALIFVQLMAIIRACDGCRGHAKRTGLIGRRLTQDDILEPVRRDLALLSERADLCPPFTVLGLFSLDSKNLLASLGVLASYLIMALAGASH